MSMIPLMTAMSRCASKGWSIIQHATKGVSSSPVSLPSTIGGKTLRQISQVTDAANTTKFGKTRGFPSFSYPNLTTAPSKEYSADAGTGEDFKPGPRKIETFTQCADKPTIGCPDKKSATESIPVPARTGEGLDGTARSRISGDQTTAELSDSKSATASSHATPILGKGTDYKTSARKLKNTTQNVDEQEIGGPDKKSATNLFRVPASTGASSDTRTESRTSADQTTAELSDSKSATCSSQCTAKLGASSDTRTESRTISGEQTTVDLSDSKSATASSNATAILGV